MPRPPRQLAAGAYYHVTSRGNNKQALFRDDSDKTYFITLLRQAREKFGIKVVSYCLMTNHYHLCLQTPQPNLNKVMEFLNVSYTRNYHRRYTTGGFLFGGRYNAKLITEDTNLLAVVRYIHLNPVKAGMVAQPWDYAWSSHPYYAGQKNDSLVDPVLVLEMLGKGEYLPFLLAKVSKREWKSLDNGRNGVLKLPKRSVGARDQGGSFSPPDSEKVPATF